MKLIVPCKRLDECIRELRTQGKIPRIWSASDLRQFLVGSFSERSLSVYPNNCSISLNGFIKGDTVKKGAKPKYYRLGRGKFVLIDENVTGLESQRNGEQKTPLSLQPIAPEDKAATQQIERARFRENVRLQRREPLLKRLLTVFPTKTDLLKYAGLCDKEYRKNSDSFSLYHSIIVKHQEIALSELLQDNDFHDLIYQTLKSWDMNFRRAKLVPFSEFSASIREASAGIVDLVEFEMNGLEKEQCPAIMSRLEVVFSRLKVMASKSKIVGVSKTLHFLLPHLVMPIDGKYTLELLFGYRVYKPALNDELALFQEIFLAFWGLANELGLSHSDEGTAGWNTTVPKIIDNAIIGYLRNL